VCVLMAESISEIHKVKLKRVFCNVYALLFVESGALKTVDCATFKFSQGESSPDSISPQCRYFLACVFLQLWVCMFQLSR